jgi:hypothetical protein
MHIPQQIPAQFGIPSIRAVRRRGARPLTTVLLGGTLLAGLTLLAACGGSTEPPPPPPNIPIPDQLYEVSHTTETNNCGITAKAEDFTLLIDTRTKGTQLLGFLQQPVSATFAGDSLTFAFPITVGSYAVTWGATWTFAEDRETFQGQTTIDFASGGSSVCIFTFRTVGSVHVPPALSTMPPLSGTPPTSSSASTSLKATHLGAALTMMADRAHIISPVGDIGQVFVNQPVLCISGSLRGVSVDGLEVDGPGQGVTGPPINFAYPEYFIMRYDEETTRTWKLENTVAAPANGIVTYGTAFFVTEIGPDGKFVPQPRIRGPVPAKYVPLGRPGWYSVFVQFVWDHISQADPYGGSDGGVIGSVFLHFDDPSGYASDGTSLLDPLGPWCYVY